MDIVDQRTGEVASTPEFLENLRGIEDHLAHAEEKVARLKDELKAARDVREHLVAQLRGAVRDGMVLPLFEGK